MFKKEEIYCDATEYEASYGFYLAFAATLRRPFGPLELWQSGVGTVLATLLDLKRA